MIDFIFIASLFLAIFTPIYFLNVQFKEVDKLLEDAEKRIIERGKRYEQIQKVLQNK